MPQTTPARISTILAAATITAALLGCASRQPLSKAAPIILTPTAQAPAPGAGTPRPSVKPGTGAVARPSGNPSAAQPGSGGQLPPLPRQRTSADIKDPRIPLLKAKIARAQIFAAYRELIDILKSHKLYGEAAALHREQARAYRRKGLMDAAIIEDNRAAELETDLQLFAMVPTMGTQVGALYTRGALEPVTGCYLGAFIDRDDNLGPGFLSSSFQTHRTAEQFEARTGRRPGSLFMYLAYGSKFPTEWVLKLKSANVIPHIAWEPKNLYQVKDDAYLREFALACRAVDWPVFFRFASEMNGKWTPYHGNPRLYREKFRLVNEVLHRHCPRAATIWCVNNPPLGNIQDYYPGDDGCDWVGVNFYSVPWHENQRSRPAFRENPLALLDPVYKLYARKKPIAICEFAASHQAKMDMKVIPEFATEKISLVYGALPLLYPRVKMINWFNMNSIQYPAPGKTLNNYLLTANPKVLAVWKAETDNPHFLTQREGLLEAPPPVARPLANLRLQLPTTIAVWAKTDSPRPKLLLHLNGKQIYRGQKDGAFRVTLGGAGLTPGRHVLTATLYTADNRVVARKSAPFWYISGVPASPSPAPATNPPATNPPAAAPPEMAEPAPPAIAPGGQPLENGAPPTAPAPQEKEPMGEPAQALQPLAPPAPEAEVRAAVPGNRKRVLS